MEKRIEAACEKYFEYEEHPAFKEELQKLLESGDESEIYDRFYTELAFGTGGLRGVIGAGFNRINPYMVKRATQGLANYLKLQNVRDPSVVIAFDSRHYSPEFAESAALVLCSNGIRAHLFSSLRPTPELSFAVRHLGAGAGIVVTASHNPSEYNGYKVYWGDGSQVVAPHDQGILEEVKKVTGTIDAMPREEAICKGLLNIIGEEIDEKYLAMIETHFSRGELIEKLKNQVKIVYTPLHGAGALLMEAALSKMGVRFTTVPEQREPDGTFPTVEYPNPEEAAALKMGIELAGKEKADLLLATDLDADRLGAAVRANGNFVLLTGNQLGSLLCDYVFSTRADEGSLPKMPVLVKTIVTTELQRRIAESYGARVYDVLTGFKFIGEKIRIFETTEEEYVFGGEESYGYLVGTEVRDKDAVSAAVITVEMVFYCKSKGSTLLDYLDELYRRFGYFQESLISKRFEGEEGKKKMEGLIDRLRSNPPATIGGYPVVEVKDYGDGSIRRGGLLDKNAIDLPRSNVLQFVLDRAIVSVRPSGTEPKIKFYLSCWKDPGTDLILDKREVAKLAELLEEEIGKMCGLDG